MNDMENTETFVISTTSEGESFLEKYKGNEKIVDIPEGITAVGDDAFLGNPWVEEVHVPSGVDYIGNYAFSSCKNLKSVFLPESIQEINIGAFYGCENLEKINLPEKLRIIGSKAFVDCPKLSFENIPHFLIEVAKDSFDDTKKFLLQKTDTYKEENGLLYNLDSKSLLFATEKNLSSVKIKNGTKYLGWNCLSNLPELEKVSVPDSVSYVGRGAFMFCKKLSKIILPASVEVIDSGAFFNCVNLSEVIVQGEGLAKICGEVFLGCELLRTITVPEECEISEESFEETCLVKHREAKKSKSVRN